MVDLGPYLNQTVEYRPKTGTDGFGKTVLGPPEQVPARYVERQQLVRNATGQEVMSSAEVLMKREPTIGSTINAKAVMNRASIVPKSGQVLGWNAYL